MKKKILNILLALGFVVPLAMYAWPSANWGSTIWLCFHVIPAICIQWLMCRIHPKDDIIRAIPLILTILLAIWGILIYITSPDMGAMDNFVVGYVSPAICTGSVWIVYHLKEYWRKPHFI